ncbi:MAG: hypothetical protein IPM29_22390 [Planctomycetes bacterium]|nr:hypothetical protein [Planctomycetota bacterium]
MLHPRLVPPLLGSLALGAACAQSPPEPLPAPIEFGTIDWRRDFDAARTEARQAGRDLLVVFQEVPG